MAGDWHSDPNDEQNSQQNSAPPVVPPQETKDDDKVDANTLIIAFVVLGVTFGAASFVLFGGDAAKDVYDAVDEQQTFAEVNASKSANRTVHRGINRANQTLRDMEREDRKKAIEDSEQLIEDLRKAAKVDIDFKKRDAIADQLVERVNDGHLKGREAQRALWENGASEHILKLKPDDKFDYFFKAIIKHRAWEKLDEIDVNELKEDHQFQAAKGYCMAGRPEMAKQIYTYVDPNDSRGRVYFNDAVACGLAPVKRNYARNAPSDTVDLFIARENLDMLVPAYESIKTQGKYRRSNTLLEAAAILYLHDKIEFGELLRTTHSARHICRIRDQYGQETASPESLLRVVEKLKREKPKKKQKERLATLVDRINTGVLVAGLTRGQDLRDKVDKPLEESEQCWARVEYEFEPAAAPKRLKNILKRARSKKDVPVAHTREKVVTALHLLALTQARLGDFEAALESAKEMQEAGRETVYAKDADALVLALAHRLGVTDQVEFIEVKDYAKDFWAAILGSDEDKLAFRVENKHGVGADAVVTYYLHGALAPGNEEAYMQSFTTSNYGLATDYRLRAEAARWRGDSEAEAKWLERRAELLEASKDPAKGGYQMALSRR